MIKHLSGFRMSKSDTKVQVSTFPGCTTLDMHDHIKPILRKKPDKLILHVGANGLKGRQSSTASAEEKISLAKSIERSNTVTELSISGLVTHSDDKALTNKVDQVNAVVKQSCQQKQWKFIDHNNITFDHLNQSKIHLNKVETSLMACNFSKHIYQNFSTGIQL